MAGKPRIWARRLLLWLNVASVLVYGLSCLAAYISPVSARYFSLLGLAFPFLMAHIFLLIFFDLVLKPKFALIPAIALLLSFRQVSVAFGLHKPVAFQTVRMHGTVRIAHWNVARFMEWRRNNNEGSQTRQRMLEQIKNQNADVLCFQEFYHSTDSLYYDNLNYISKRFHYPYVYFSWDSDGWKQWFGQVIFSRLPIVDTGRVRFPRPGMPETLLYADVVTGRDTVRIFTTHLQSYKLDKVDYERIEKIKNREDSILDNSKNVVQKLTRASQYRAAQADLVNKAVAKSPYPAILTADLNDVPNSYTYHSVRGELQDAFLEKGLGIGRTYYGLSPTLRIDYILASKQWEVVQFKRINRALSDHYMLVADLRLRN
jgi:endonuclease/exonuclease/phosphatase family metal-dependent hydrolase